MLHALFRAVARFFAALTRGWAKVRLLFLSGSGAEKRASGKFATLQEREMEAERLDRLRNPGDYQGR